MKDDQCPRFGFEAAEAALELVAVRDGRCHVVRGEEVDRSQFHVDAMAPQPARLIDAGAVEQAVEPGAEAVWIAQRWQPTPGPDEGLLDSVLCSIRVAQDEPRGGIQPEERGVRKRGEGVMIAPSRSLHEFLLHLTLGGGATDVAALTEYGEATAGVRSNIVRAVRRRGTIALPHRPRGAEAAREDPGSRREVAARRAGPARSRLGGRP